MTARILLLPFTCASLLAIGACDRPAAPAAATAEAAPAKTAGSTPPSTFEGAFKYTSRWEPENQALVIGLDVAPGFHAYAAGETVGRPLSLDFVDASDYVVRGAVEYPKGEPKDLPLGRSVIVEGKAEIVAPLALKKPEGGDAGKSAKALLKYQVCTESSCDRPRTVEIGLPIPAAK